MVVLHSDQGNVSFGSIWTALNVSFAELPVNPLVCYAQDESPGADKYGQPMMPAQPATTAHEEYKYLYVLKNGVWNFLFQFQAKEMDFISVKHWVIIGPETVI